jgi:hypothetical protein
VRGRPDASALIERFAGDDRYLVDYLTAEILARQPPELRWFLLGTGTTTSSANSSTTSWQRPAERSSRFCTSARARGIGRRA